MIRRNHAIRINRNKIPVNLRTRTIRVPRIRSQASLIHIRLRTRCPAILARR